MHPFERHGESVKKLLSLAQEEAERSHHAHVGTEHILLGLLRDGHRNGARILNGVGIELDWGDEPAVPCAQARHSRDQPDDRPDEGHAAQAGDAFHG
jgi:ATP-dependent Clp protease ATP-binding subunit ClpA